MRKLLLFLFLIPAIVQCMAQDGSKPSELGDLAAEVIFETSRTWESYNKYARGHDVLRTISGEFHDWYSEPLYISPIDAYSTLKVLGLEEDAKEIAKVLNKHLSGPTAPRFYKVVEDDYELQPGFKP